MPTTQLDTEDALRLLEVHPGFPRVQLQIAERVDVANRDASSEASVPGTGARLEHVLKLQDIRSEGFLELVTGVEMQRAFPLVQDPLWRLAWQEYTGVPIDLLQPASDRSERALEAMQASTRKWIREGYKRLESLPAARRKQAAGLSRDRLFRSGLHPTKWEDIRLKLLSDHRLEIRVNNETEQANYRELGLYDARGGNPNQAWKTLVRLAESGNGIQTPGPGEKSWKTTEKRIQSVRKFLRAVFNLPDDPLPFVKGHGYQPRFVIECDPAFNT